MATRFTGRNLPQARTGRPLPHLRFRQAQVQQRLNPNKPNHKHRHNGGAFHLGPLTTIGAVAVSGGALLIVFLLYFFVFSTTFLVKNVNIISPTTLAKDQLNEAFYKIEDTRILGIIPGNHILFLSKKRMLNALAASYPYVGQLNDFKKTWPDKISFAIAEKPAVFVWTQSSGQVYLLDKDGYVLGPATTVPANLVVLEGGADQQPSLGKKLVGSQTLDFAASIQKNWPTEWSFKPTHYKILQIPGGGEFSIDVDEGWYIKADTNINSETFLKNLTLLLNSQIKDEQTRKNLAYIDLRLETRAYYCLKGQPCASANK